MKTKISLMDEQNIDKKSLEEAGEIIRDGGLVAFPTETVYGLGANALNGEAVQNIFKVKGRPQDNPLIVHVGDFNIDRFVKNVPEIAHVLMKMFWPGPLTIILKKSDLIPEVTSAGLDTVGLRMPANTIALELIRAAGVPIAAPSANISGRPSPTEVSRCVEDLQDKIEYIIGGSRSKVGLESTIVDCTQNPPCILRPGGITLEMLKKVNQDIYIDSSIMKAPEEDFRPKAPGMKYRHYAPKAMVKIIEGDLQKTIEKINEIVQNIIGDGKRVGIMVTDETREHYNNGVIISLGSRKDLSTVGKNLFEVLRTLDDEQVDIILSESFDEAGMGVAIMNRLKKAASYDIIRV
jgi:L-threonylcarbamoyladenylate synthase